MSLFLVVLGYMYNIQKKSSYSETMRAGPQGFPFKKIFRGHCDPQVVDLGGHFQFERVTY